MQFGRDTATTKKTSIGNARKARSFADGPLNRWLMCIRCWRIEIFHKCTLPCHKKITYNIIGSSFPYIWEIRYLHFPSRTYLLFLVLIIIRLTVLTLRGDYIHTNKSIWRIAHSGWELTIRINFAHSFFIKFRV